MGLRLPHWYDPPILGIPRPLVLAYVILVAAVVALLWRPGSGPDLFSRQVPRAGDAARRLKDLAAREEREARRSGDVDELMAAGTLQDLAGEPERAEALYREVLRREPSHREALNNLAYLYAVQGRNLQEALDLVNRALKGPLRPAHIVDTRAWVYYRLATRPGTPATNRGIYLANALEDAEAAVRGDPRRAEMRYHLGRIHQAMGNPDAARVELMKALALDPELRDARLALEEIQQETRRSGKGRERGGETPLWS